MPEAIDILLSRKAAEPAEFVFPGNGKSGHREDPTKGWERVLDRDGLNQLTKRIRLAGGEFEWPALRAKKSGDKGPKYESLGMSLDRARKLAAKMGIDTTERGWLICTCTICAARWVVGKLV